MLRIIPNHDVNTESLNGDYLKGQFLDGLYLANNGQIYMTARGKGKAHLAVIGAPSTVCNRGTSKMSSPYSLTPRSNPIKLCKSCQGATKRLGFRLLSGGWHDVPILARLHSFEMLKDGFNRLIAFKGLKPFHMTRDMNHPYIAALVSGERTNKIDTKVYFDRKRQLTTLEELHDTALVDLVEMGAKNRKVRFEFMKFYPVTSSLNLGGTDFTKRLSSQLEAARELLGYGLLEAGVIFLKPVNSPTLYHALAFNVYSTQGADKGHSQASGVVALSGVPHNMPLGGQMGELDVCMNLLTSLVKSKLGSMQRWVI